MQAFHKKLLVLGMGGTIAGRSQAQGDNVGYTAGELPVESLLPRGVSNVECLANVQIETRQIAQMDSKDMDHATWFVLARAVLAACADEAVAGIVITHGTDTLEETAFFLSQLFTPSKPVVLTCAMRPATALSPDGPQNMVDALCVAANPSADGVWVVAAGAVHRPTQVAKVHPYRTDAFSSGETGPVGVVEEGRLRWLHPAGGNSFALSPSTAASRQFEGSSNLGTAANALLARLESKGLPRVEWVVSHAGVTPAAVTTCLIAGSEGGAVRGLVLVCTGNGTFHQCLTKPLRDAEARGVWLRRSTRCTQGNIVVGATSVDWPVAMPLDPVKARIALSLDIARHDLAGLTPQATAPVPE